MLWRMMGGVVLGRGGEGGGGASTAAVTEKPTAGVSWASLAPSLSLPPPPSPSLPQTVGFPMSNASWLPWNGSGLDTVCKLISMTRFSDNPTPTLVQSAVLASLGWVVTMALLVGHVTVARIRRTSVRTVKVRCRRCGGHFRAGVLVRPGVWVGVWRFEAQQGL
jgi:hypothetical protein